MTPAVWWLWCYTEDEVPLGLGVPPGNVQVIQRRAHIINRVPSVNFDTMRGALSYFSRVQSGVLAGFGTIITPMFGACGGASLFHTKEL